MALEKVISDWTAPAASDLSALKYTLVKFDSSGNLTPASTGDNAFVLLSSPTTGHYGTIALAGVAKVKLAGTVAAGGYVSSNSGGLAVAATSTVTSTGGSYSAGTAGTHIVGQALAAGVANDLIPILVNVGLA